MKRYLKSLVALLLVTVILLSLTLSTFALSYTATGEPVKYSTSKNSGEKDVLCTSLDGTTASSYYTGSYTYETLSQLKGDSLLQKLRTLMKSTHSKQTSYADCKNYSDETDCENEDGRVVLLYTSYSATMGDWISGSTGWNREHVWPQSLGGFSTSGAGADLHHIRPDDNKTNGTRGNKLFGNVNDGANAVASSTVPSGIYGGTYRGNYFEPNDNVKGDVARICLYVYVRYGGEISQCSKITNVFQSVDVLLDWCELDPVDTWEMGRNEVVAKIQGNRNVFIDYPEYAWLVFGEDVPEGMTTPSGGEGSGSGSSSGGTTGCAHSSTELRGQASATCGAAGYTGDTYCKSCGEKVATGSTIAATGKHTWANPVVVTPPTETEDGLERYTCSVCNITGTLKIPATGTGSGGSTDTPDTPDVPDTPDTPDNPVVPDIPVVPDTPNEPSNPDGEATDVDEVVLLLGTVDLDKDKLILLLHMGITSGVYYDLLVDATTSEKV